MVNRETYQFCLPDLAEGMHEAEIARWLVREGERVEADQDLVEILHDKANQTLSSPRSGTVTALHGKEGSLIRVGEPLVTLDADPDGHGAPAGGEKRSGNGASTRTGQRAGAGEPPGQPVTALPRVRRRARELGLDLASIQGSGPGGRIEDPDLERAAAAQRTGAAQENPDRLPLRGVRREIAQHLHQAHRDTAPCTLVEECDFTELVSLRERARPLGQQQGVQLTYLPFILAAISLALADHPLLNARFDPETSDVLVWRRERHISIAVNTEKGLVTPVVRHVEQRSILELAREIERLSLAARSGSIRPEELQGGTFTVSSLGRIGGVMATPLLNTPQVSTLVVHRIAPRPVVFEGQITQRQMANLSLTFDHRYVDGYDAAEFMQALVSRLADPAVTLLTMIEMKGSA